MQDVPAVFTHLLITRFNIQVDGYGPERMESPSMSGRWMEERIKLFIPYCAPSVNGQTETRFIWIWYLDPRTPAAYISRLRSCMEEKIQVEIRHAEDYAGMLEDTRQYIRQLPTPYVITSRLDNDDIISHDFIARIQSAFIPSDRTIINFLSGYEYGTADHVLKRWNVRYMNQFISLIEATRTDQLLTIYAFPHWKIPADARIINIGEAPYWIYLRHAHNASVQKINAIPVFLKSSRLRRFPSFYPIVKINFRHTLRYALAWLPQMVARRGRNLLKRISGS